jgi:hypothetical protein
MEVYMNLSESKDAREILLFDVPDHLKQICLITRRQLAKFLNIGVSHLDKIPESELPRIKIGKSVRFTLESVKQFIINKSI